MQKRGNQRNKGFTGVMAFMANGEDFGQFTASDEHLSRDNIILHLSDRHCDHRNNFRGSFLYD